jgi:AraC-like DNA-binding protein
MRLTHGSQLTLELQPGLLRRYSTIREAVHHSVLNDPRGMKGVAADCDISVSELSRRLAPTEGDPRSLDVNLFDAILTSTGDLTPLHWLNAKHLADAEAKKRAAFEAAARVLPELLQALADAGIDMKRGRR